MKNRKPIENAVDIEMQGDMLIILSTLCENDVHRKVGIESTFRMLHWDSCSIQLIHIQL